MRVPAEKFVVRIIYKLRTFTLKNLLLFYSIIEKHDDTDILNTSPKKMSWSETYIWLFLALI